MINLIIDEKIDSFKNSEMKILPNNIERIMKRFKYNDSSLAEIMRLEKSYINLVKQQKANLSGSGTILLMKKLNISFNLIYNINKEVPIQKESIEEFFSIFEINDDINNDEIKKEIALYIEKLKDVKSEEILYLKYFSKLENGIIDLSDENTRYVNEKLKKQYKELAEKNNFNKENSYIVVGYTIKKYTNKLLEINFSKNMDTETTMYLFKKKFSKKSLYKFKEYREYKGYDKQYMADLIGLSVGTYNLLENAEQQISTRVMWRIENNLGIPVESIINIDAYYDKFVKSDYSKR